MKWIYDNSFDSFSLEIGDYLISREILIDEITEAVFMVKKDSREPDSSAKVSLVLGNGLTKTPGDTPTKDVILASFRATDFGELALVSGENYSIGLGIKTASMSKFLEAEPLDNKLTVLNDFIHD